MLSRSLLGAGLGLACLLAGCHPAVPEDAEVNPMHAAAPPLPASDPLAFLQKCLERYDAAGIETYQARFDKQERIDGVLRPPEVIDVAFRARPYSVLMRWRQGARRAASALYVEGQNDGQMLVHPTGVAGLLRKVVALGPDGPQARQASRYSIKEFGLRKTLARTLRDWQTAHDQGTLQAEYLGIQKLPGGERPCYVLRATFQRPQKDDIVETTVLLDQDTWLQVGTVLHGPQAVLVGRYFYRDLRINASLPPGTFEPAALSP
jgi:hypothetical protein